MGIAKNANTVHFEPIDYPIFFTLGKAGLGKVYSPQTGLDVNFPLDRQGFSVNSNRFLKNKSCVILRYYLQKQKEDYEEYWVDLSNRSAIVRMDSYIGGQLDLRIDIDYKDQNIYPKSWTVNYFESDKGKVGFFSSLSVQEIFINPTVDSEEYDIQLKPGMIVRQGDAKQSQTGFNLKDYLVSDDGKTIIEIPDSNVSPSVWAKTFWFFLFLVLLTIAFFIIYKKSRK